MWNINTSYIDGAFAPVQGSETIEVVDPTTESPIGHATLANREDAKAAIAAAQRAQKRMGRTSKAERMDMLRRLEAAVMARTDQLRDVTIAEYGGPYTRSEWISQYSSQCFATTAQALESYELTRRIGDATVVMEPVGVAALITPWNAAIGTICSKLASAIAAGCACVIKPSELGAIQAHVLTQALHDAGLPPGVFNVVLGRGTDVGDELSVHPGIAKMSFTGSTATGQRIAGAALGTMKRVSLSLSGKSASVVLDDADVSAAVPLAVNVAFMNNGQACVAGTRLLVPRPRYRNALESVQLVVSKMQVGDPRQRATTIGPLLNAAQRERVQGFMRRGVEQGATVLAGGAGRPQGLDKGYFVKPTVFSDVRNDMEIARSEVFGPVLSVLAYDTEEEAVQIANDSAYGLNAYVFSSSHERAMRVASQLQAGSVLINRINPELRAPFGGMKQSGIGREFGAFGLEAFLEPKSIAGV